MATNSKKKLYKINIYCATAGLKAFTTKKLEKFIYNVVQRKSLQAQLVLQKASRKI